MSETEAREGVTVINLDEQEAEQATERHNLSLALPVDLHERLLDAKVATKRSVSALIREAITAHLPTVEAEAKQAAAAKLDDLRAELARLEAITGESDEASESEVQEGA